MFMLKNIVYVINQAVGVVSTSSVFNASSSIILAYIGEPSETCSRDILITPTMNGGVITRSRCYGSMMRAPGRNWRYVMLMESWV